MHIRDLSGKKVCVLGYGKEGKAMVDALEKFVPRCSLTVADRNQELRIMNYECQLGETYMDKLDRFDVVIKSPGIPMHSKLKAQSSKLTSSTQIFLDTIRDSGTRTIGVTGSKGKSTTASLIHEILQADEQRATSNEQTYLIGNIGEPAIAHIADAKPGTIFVMEMSSYQLADLHVSPGVAVVTTFFPEHLDYHASTALSTGSTPLEAYKNAKKNIARFQHEGDAIFYSATSDVAREIALMSPGTRIPFSADECPVPIEETHLLGEHNRSNIAAAWKVGQRFGIPQETMLAVFRSFRGLPHRLESLGIHNGIEWVDDAISTTPESTIAALDALGRSVASIILGGQDRGNDFITLGKRIAASKIKTVILFPGSGPRIKKAIEKAGASVQFFDAASMEEAVYIAHRETRNEKRETIRIVLLSTASPSYGMFKNFEEKGDAFQRGIESENIV